MPTFVRIASATILQSSDAGIGCPLSSKRGIHHRPGAEHCFVSLLWFGIWPDRSNRLAQQQLGITLDDKITEFANRFIPHPGVKAPCVLVEVRYADEYVRRFAKYA